MLAYCCLFVENVKKHEWRMHRHLKSNTIRLLPIIFSDI